MARTAFLLLLVLIPSGAMADKTAAEACAANLPPEARTIYTATAPKFTPSANLRTLITDETKALVKAGSVQKASARESAQAAGQCLEKMK